MIKKFMKGYINTIFPSILAGLLALSVLGVALAQETEPVILELNRDFGYSSGTGRIQGAFTARATGPQDLARVVFLIDGVEMGEASQPPFELKFSTGDYPYGTHTLVAVGYTSSGEVLRSNEQRREFVPAEEGWQTAGKIALPIVAVVFLMMLLSYVLPSLIGRGKQASMPLGARRSYGMVGGTICPKCKRPFSMHLWGFNLIGGKLDRCPYCGRWSMVHRVSQDELRRAEAAELLQATAPAQQGPSEDDLRKELEDSRYQDL